MQRFAYYLVLPLLYFVSLFPYALLYIISDLLYFLLFQIFRYRRKVVSNNLKNAFPDKAGLERLEIEKKFYRHLCDLMVEFFKTLTMSKADAVRRCHITPASVDLLNNFYENQKNLVLVMGHYGNWEWGGLSISLQVKHPLFFIYKPLNNTNFDGLMFKMRSRFGAKLISMNIAFREMVKYKESRNATAFIADQTAAPESAYWTRFLNQDTPVFLGTEKIARKMNYPVVFINIQKIKRGYYELTAELLSQEPSKTSDGVISELHTKRLEKEIMFKPEFWLWSHRRWKHKRPLNI